MPRNDYRIGVPAPGFYREVLNSDAEVYGGTNMGNWGGAKAEPVSWMGRPYSILVSLPPLGALVLVHEPEKEEEDDAASELAFPDEAAEADGQ